MPAPAGLREPFMMHRRTLLATLLATTAAGSARAALPAPPPGGMAIVVNSLDATLSLIGIQNRTELGRVQLLREPHHLVLSPDHSTLLVGDSAGNEMLFLDPRSAEIRRRIAVADPYQFGFSPDARTFVVNGLARNQVDVYDAATMALKHRFPAPKMPSHLAFTPDSATVFITLQGTDKLGAYDLTTMQEKWVVPVGEAPAGVLLDRGRLLVANMGTNDVVVLNPADGREIKRFPTAKGAHQIFRSPDAKVIWVNNRVESCTIAYDAVTLERIRLYRVTGGPDDIAFAPDGNLWLTLRWVKKVAVLDPKTGDYSTIDVGRSPHGIFLTTDV